MSGTVPRLSRNHQAYRQWLDTWIITRCDKHLKTAMACFRIARQEYASQMTEFQIYRASLTEHRLRPTETATRVHTRTELTEPNDEYERNLT